MLRLSLSALFVFLLGCPSGEATPDPTPTPDYVYEEDDDSGNGSPFEPEEVETDWDPEVNQILTIKGTMESCGYDVSEGWPWTGDEDNFAVTLPATGVLAMETDWDGGAGDLDWLWWSEVPQSGPTGGTASPDHQIDGDTSEMHYEFGDDNFDEGTTMVFTFACKNGSGGDYAMTFDLEP